MYRFQLLYSTQAIIPSHTLSHRPTPTWSKPTGAKLWEAALTLLAHCLYVNRNFQFVTTCVCFLIHSMPSMRWIICHGTCQPHSVSITGDCRNKMLGIYQKWIVTLLGNNDKSYLCHISLSRVCYGIPWMQYTISIPLKTPVLDRESDQSKNKSR